MVGSGELKKFSTLGLTQHLTDSDLGGPDVLRGPAGAGWHVTDTTGSIPTCALASAVLVRRQRTVDQQELGITEQGMTS
jgi:hypothetical protein